MMAGQRVISSDDVSFKRELDVVKQAKDEKNRGRPSFVDISHGYDILSREERLTQVYIIQ